MPYAIELFFDNACDAFVRGLWQRLEQAGISDFLNTHRSIPHITLAICDQMDLELTREMVDELATALPPIELAFVSLGIFPYQSWTVYLGLHSSEKLIEVQRHCQQMLTSCDCQLWPNYLPDQWIPHCTIGMELTRQQALATMEQVSHVQFPVPFTILGIGIVELDPVRIHITRQFEG